MQQLHLAGFLAKHSCTVAGIGDTRLGDDITSFKTTVTHAALAEPRAPWRRSRAAAQAHRVGRPRRVGTHQGRCTSSPLWVLKCKLADFHLLCAALARLRSVSILLKFGKSLPSSFFKPVFASSMMTRVHLLSLA